MNEHQRTAVEIDKRLSTYSSTFVVRVRLALLYVTFIILYCTLWKDRLTISATAIDHGPPSNNLPTHTAPNEDESHIDICDTDRYQFLIRWHLSTIWYSLYINFCAPPNTYIVTYMCIIYVYVYIIYIYEYTESLQLVHSALIGLRPIAAAATAIVVAVSSSREEGI